LTGVEERRSPEEREQLLQSMEHSLFLTAAMELPQIVKMTLIHNRGESK